MPKDSVQFGPNPMRETATVRKLMTVLADSGWLVILPDGVVIDGKARKLAYRIVMPRDAAWPCHPNSGNSGNSGTVPDKRTANLTTQDSDNLTLSVCVKSRKVVWLFLEQLWFEFVPVLHGLQGRLAARG